MCPCESEAVAVLTKRLDAQLYARAVSRGHGSVLAGFRPAEVVTLEP